MSPARRAIAAIMIAWLGSLSPSQADEKCALVRVASVDMRTDETGRVYVPITIAGRHMNMLIDSGSPFSVLNQAVVDSLSLSTSRIPHGTYFVVFGGLEVTQYTTARNIEFGGLKASNLDFLVMPDGRLPPDIDGLLGSDVLHSYDDEFDFASAKFSLFEPHTCPGDIAYWTHDPHAEIPFNIDSSGHIQFSVALDGKEIQATLDTGASRSVLIADDAQDISRSGKKKSLREDSESSESLHGNEFSYKTLVFGQSSSELGTVTVNNPDLPLVSRPEAKIPDRPDSPNLILGMGILRQLHLYIAYKEKKLYATAASAH